MILYLIKSTFLLLIFCLIFKWNLENKKSLQFIRYFLLASIVFALVVPLINFQFLVPQNKIVETKEYLIDQLPSIPIVIENTVPEKSTSILLIIYVLISSVFLSRFIYNVCNILNIKNSGRKEYTSFGKLIISNKVTAPFTFCNYIYLNDLEWESNNINPAILYHEQAHVKQNHSVDVLFIELLKIVLWFQPFLYYFKRIVQENHEYLADEFTLQKTTNLKNYQKLILNYYGNNQPIVALSSSIHFNNLKKRFIMMKNTKKGKVWGTIFYSCTIALTYVGFVGIEAKASDIKKAETIVSNVIEQAVKQPEKIELSETVRDEIQAELKDEIKRDSIILAYIKGEKSSGYFNHKEGVYLYVVDENLKVSIYNRYGVVQKEKDFTYELKAVSKEEKEKLTQYELKRASQVKNDHQDVEGLEKIYTDVHSFVEKKAMPKEGLKNFMQDFSRKFVFPQNYPTNAENHIKFRLKFIVEKDGSFSEIKGGLGDEEILVNAGIEVLKTMPKWSPAEHQGQVVRSKFTMPITIRVSPAKIDMPN